MLEILLSGDSVTILFKLQKSDFSEDSSDLKYSKNF